MKTSSIIKILFLPIVLLFLFTSCEKKKQNIVQKIDNTAEIKMLQEKANDFFNSGKNDSSFFYFNKVKLLCEPKIEHFDEFVHSSVMMGNILQKNGDFYEAETMITKAIPYLEKTSQPKFTINTYSSLGYNYYRTYDYEKSLNCYRKALKNAVSTFRKSSEISNIAFIYVQQKKYKEAIDLLEPLTKRTIIDKVVPLNTHAERASKLYHLGLSYLRLENHQKQALDCFNESLELTLKSGNDFELIPNYYALYLYYKKYDNPELKMMNAQKAYDCSKRSKSMAEQITTLGNLIEADDVQNTRKHWKAYIRLVDSTANSMKIAKNQFANIIYDSKKDKEENLELKNQKTEKELQLQIQKNRSTILYVIIGIVALVSLFLAYYLTAKSKKEKNEAVLKSEMHISDKLHNELTNDIHNILMFAQNHELDNIENKEKFLSSLNNVYAKTRNISRENSEIITDRRYIDNLKNMISQFKTSDVNILINGLNDINWVKIDKHKKIVIYRIVQEVFLNMKKHSDATLVGINFKVTERKLIIKYTDNGKGISINEINRNGLTIVQNRISNINGETYFDSAPEQGLKISFKIPV